LRTDTRSCLSVFAAHWASRFVIFFIFRIAV
jgi:hypothetical protein